MDCLAKVRLWRGSGLARRLPPAKVS
jgi:hypothetical protein